MRLSSRKWQLNLLPQKLLLRKRKQMLTQHRQQLIEPPNLHKHRSKLSKLEMKKLLKQLQMLPDKRQMQIKHELWQLTEPLKHRELKLQSMQPSLQLLRKPKDFKMQPTQQQLRKELKQKLQERHKMQQL